MNYCRDYAAEISSKRWKNLDNLVNAIAPFPIAGHIAVLASEYLKEKCNPPILNKTYK